MKKLPYAEYRNSKLWRIIEQELNELVENQDIEITTMPDLVVGSLVKAVTESSAMQEK